MRKTKDTDSGPSHLMDVRYDLADAGKNDRQFVTALARGLEVLRAFGPGSGPLGNQEIAEFAGLPKPTVSRLTHTLTKLGYLNYLPRLGKYELGTAGPCPGLRRAGEHAGAPTGASRHAGTRHLCRRFGRPG